MTDELSLLRAEVRRTRRYVVALSCLLLAASVTAFRAATAPTRFKEIDVERINVREPDGKLRMIIANRAMSSGPIARGKPFGYGGGNRPGIIFFNDEETENGGLVFEGKRENGVANAGAQLSFDQYEQDQILYLTYQDENGQRITGLNVVDRPDTTGGRRPGPIGNAPRVFVGRDASRSAVLRLSDPFGRPRIRISVDSMGIGRIEFLDGRGHVVQTVPSSAPDSANRGAEFDFVRFLR